MSVDHPAKAKRNIEQRKAAEVAHELAVTIEGEHGFENAKRYWENVVRLARKRLPLRLPLDDGEEEKPNKMTDQEAKAFGQQETMPFGEFAGMKVDDVPLDRLLWYADQTFTDDLRRYLESDRVKGENR